MDFQGSVTWCQWKPSSSVLITTMGDIWNRSRVLIKVGPQRCHSDFFIQYTTNINLSLQWRHNGRDCVSNHQPHDCFLSRSLWRRSRKTSKLRVTGLCVGNSPMTGEFPAQMASNAENISIWWRHHVTENPYSFSKAQYRVDTQRSDK